MLKTRFNFFCVSMIISFFAQSQESFLKLDSIVSKVDDITLSLLPGSSGSSSYYAAVDTLILNVPIGSVCKLRLAGMSITETGSSLSTRILSRNSDDVIYDSRITVDDFNVFTSLQLTPPNSNDNYKDYSDFQIVTKGFSGLSKVDMFLTTGTHRIIFHCRVFHFNPQVSGLLELIYYSYEN